MSMKIRLNNLSFSILSLTMSIASCPSLATVTSILFGKQNRLLIDESNGCHSTKNSQDIEIDFREGW